MLFILKAQVRGAGTADLFAAPVLVAAHVREGHIVKPHTAIRYKAPPQAQAALPLLMIHQPKAEPPKPVVVIKPLPPGMDRSTRALLAVMGFHKEEERRLEQKEWVFKQNPKAKLWSEVPQRDQDEDARWRAVNNEMLDTAQADIRQMTREEKDKVIEARALIAGTMTKALLFKAQIKGANTGDLFSEPVNVKSYVRDGHTVRAHTEIRQVHHERPAMSDEAATAAAHDVIAHHGGWLKSYGKNPPSTSPAGWVSHWAGAQKRKLSDADEGKIIDAVFKLIRQPQAQSPPAPKSVASAPAEPDHITQGRASLAKYEARRSLTAMEEKSRDLWRMRLAADPAKWKPGMGVSYQVSGGAKMQTNRGFRIASIDVAGKRAVLRQVADTGLTSSGGDNDRFEDSYVYLGELKRDKNYDVPVPIVSKPARVPEMAYPDTNSNDPDQVLAWVRKIAVGHGDVINDRSISREAENRYYVQGHKKPVSYIGRVVELLLIGAKKYPKSAA